MVRCFQSWMVRCSPCPLKFSHSNNINKEVKQIWASDTSFLFASLFLIFMSFAFIYMVFRNSIIRDAACICLKAKMQKHQPLCQLQVTSNSLEMHIHLHRAFLFINIVKLVHRGVQRVMYSIVEQALRSGLWMSTWGSGAGFNMPS